ncbi:MAG: (Fe-S)-binding protein [Candidatus Delongbacteria bacterium]|nr:(Fe-S)-binding protein [Candidatus Delongbacteria bacterium]MBN2836581.1 (Fe-S)-binding protein [Candidatus Delongbacteria bacterium]
MKEDVIYSAENFEEYSKCTLCGNCRVVCPTFLAEKRESASCRGRVNLIGGLIKDTQPITLSEKLEFDIGMCLNCMSCEYICPAGVYASDFILSAKADIFAKYSKMGLKSFFKNRIIFIKMMFFKFIVRKLKGLDRAAVLYRKSYPILTNKDKKIRAFFKPFMKYCGFNPERILPFLEKRLDVKNLEIEKPLSSFKKRVIFFPGCTGRNIASPTAEHIVNLLHKYGYEVIVFEKDYCCGAPAYYNGDLKTVNQNAEKITRYYNNFNETDAILTMCGSCGNMLLNEYPKLGFNFKAPVLDVMEFLINEKNDLKVRYRNTSVTYHHSCHLLKGMKTGKNIVNEIKKVYGDNFKPLDEADVCCGGGGTFSYTYYETAKKITSRKTDKIRKADVQLTATGCMNCQMRISEQSIVENKKLNVIHTAELFE